MITTESIDATVGLDEELPFTPSEEDLADYRRWVAELEARREAEEQRIWWDANPIESFNAVRCDESEVPA